MTPFLDPTLAASPTEPPQPVRIQVVDALRGFALFGILLVHCAQWFTAGPLPNAVYQAHASGPANSVAQAIVGIFFDGKFYTFFSFLFGLSFALMMTRSQESSSVFYRRFAWRLIILGAIGFLHHLHWRGDILSIYALLGFLMLPFGRFSNRWVLIVGLLLIANVPNRIRAVYTTYINPPVQSAKPQQPDQSYEKESQAFYNTLKEGSYADVAKSNLNAFDDKMQFQVESGRIYITLGFFLMGLYAGRRRLFQRLDDNRALFRKLTKYLGFSVLGLTAAGVGIFLAFGNSQQPPKFIELLFMTLYDLHSAVLTLFYIAGLTLLFQRRFWQWAVGPLASVGKMALTSYILQSVIGGLLFFGYGFSLLANVDMWVAALLTIPIFLVQVFFSQFWLSQFRFGPLEWLWRSLTYLKAQPMRLSKAE